MICRQCGQDKVAGDFYWTKEGWVKENQFCKECCKIKWQQPEHVERQMYNYVKSKYGLNREEYDAMLAKQDGKCAICEKAPKLEGRLSASRLHVDHDTVTGKVRGLLCHNCNVGIGFLGHDWNRVMKVLDYLNFHELGHFMVE